MDPVKKNEIILRLFREKDVTKIDQDAYKHKIITSPQNIWFVLAFLKKLPFKEKVTKIAPITPQLIILEELKQIFLVTRNNSNVLLEQMKIDPKTGQPTDFVNQLIKLILRDREWLKSSRNLLKKIMTLLRVITRNYMVEERYFR